MFKLIPDIQNAKSSKTAEVLSCLQALLSIENAPDSLENNFANLKDENKWKQSLQNKVSTIEKGLSFKDRSFL